MLGPLTFDKAVETKDSFNPKEMGSAYSNYLNYDLEIIILKSTFERFTKTVTTKLDKLDF